MTVNNPAPAQVIVIISVQEVVSEDRSSGLMRFARPVRDASRFSVHEPDAYIFGS